MDDLGESYQKIKIQTLDAEGAVSNDFIVSKTLEESGVQDAISTSGMHQGIIHNGLVYDNIHKDGIPLEDWLNDFESITNKFRTTIE